MGEPYGCKGSSCMCAHIEKKIVVHAQNATLHGDRLAAGCFLAWQLPYVHSTHCTRGLRIARCARRKLRSVPFSHFLLPTPFLLLCESALKFPTTTKGSMGQNFLPQVPKRQSE